MKSLSHDNRISEAKTEEVASNQKQSLCNPARKLQQLIEANAEAETHIKILEKQVQGLEAEHVALDQQLKNKRDELEKQKQDLESDSQKDQQQAQQQMKQWIVQIQNFSGVSQQVMDSLISMEYQNTQNDSQICLSCYQPMQQGVQCKYLPCCHIFHAECIDKHLRVNKLCPGCGEPVAP